MGRPVVDSDVCSLEELNQRFLEEGNVRKLLIDIATSDAFLMGKAINSSSSVLCISFCKINCREEKMSKKRTRAKIDFT